MEVQRLKFALFGVLLGVITIHAGIFSDATSLLPSKITGTTTTSRVLVSENGKEITAKDLENSVNFAKNVIGYMKRLETNLMWSDIKVKRGTPSHGMFISFGPEREAVKRGRDALVGLKATIQLMGNFCHKKSGRKVQPIDFDECAKFITKYNFAHTSLKSACDVLNKRCTDEELYAIYRATNGSCNHYSKGILGESFTAYSRLLPPDYLDGIHELRRSVTKQPLPSPRAVVNALVKHDERPHDRFTLAVMQWSQFVEHDLSRTAQAVAVHTDNPIECCGTEGNTLSPRYVHPFCSPISVPTNDPLYASKGVNCLSYVRSVLALRPDCAFGPSEQVNQATHYLDGSQIYGSTIRKTATLRTFVDGKLETSVSTDGKTYLPESQNPTEDCQLFSNISTCYKSGDSRVNFQPQLTAMHTLWFREHNRIAEELSRMNRRWDDETLFQEARRIVVAEMQRITYNEWTNAVLGKKYAEKLEGFNRFEEKINPSVSNSFANAAMRSLKSLYDGKFRMYDEARNENESLTLRNYFNNPTILEQTGVLDALIRGLATQSSQKLDIYYAEDLIGQLYTNGRFGFDILSFDVQRGRDHGFPGYVAYRSLCGLRNAENFKDFHDAISKEDIGLLSKVYASHEDVDLIIGGLLERAEEDSLLGPTFACIVADQMARTRRGDRYFYTNQRQPKPFSKAQIQEIDKVTLARIFCDNGDDIRTMQPNVFEKITASNDLVSCSGEEIPRMNLDAWKDNSEFYYQF